MLIFSIVFMFWSYLPNKPLLDNSRLEARRGWSYTHMFLCVERLAYKDTKNVNRCYTDMFRVIMNFLIFLKCPISHMACFFIQSISL